MNFMSHVCHVQKFARHSLDGFPYNIRIPMILLSSIATISHAWRPLVINIVTHDPIDGTVGLRIRIVMMIVAVTSTAECRMVLNAITGIGAIVQRALAIRYETIWCR
jgi:hypothetical protein